MYKNSFLLFVVTGLFTKEICGIGKDCYTPQICSDGSMNWISTSSVLGEECNDNNAQSQKQKYKEILDTIKSSFDRSVIDFNEKLKALASKIEQVRNFNTNQVQTSADHTTKTTMNPLLAYAITTTPVPCVNTTKPQCLVQCGAQCYWSMLDKSFTLNYARSSAQCRAGGSSSSIKGHPANIYNKQQYDVIMQHLRTSLPQRTTNSFFWLGMTYDQANGTLLSTFNTTDVYVEWYYGNPKTGTRAREYTQMALRVRSNPKPRYNGMFNYPPNYKIEGVLCEKNIGF